VSVQVVSVCNREPDRSREPYYNLPVFLKSLARFGDAPTILGMNEPWGGLMTKPRRLRKWLREGNCIADLLIVCDAFDIVFTVPATDVAAKYREIYSLDTSTGDAYPIVFNAEKGIFPRGELSPAFDNVPGPWKYLNSGFMIAPPDKILALLESMWLDDIIDDRKAEDELHGGAGRWINPNDQGWYQAAYAMRVVPMVLDYWCRIAQCCSACTIKEFDLSGTAIKNAVTNETPLVFHMNGASKNDLMPVFLKHWGLE
jgi:hypothetical protein